jgi:hypothetical protein
MRSQETGDGREQQDELAPKPKRTDAAGCHHTNGALHSRAWRMMVTGAIALFLVLSWRSDCWAYIDPNAGGFVTQILAPLVSIFLSFLFYCRNEIKRLVKSVRNRWRGNDSRGAAPEARK